MLVFDKTFRFEEVQLLRFVVYDVAGAFSTSDASKLIIAEQVSVQFQAQSRHRLITRVSTL